MIRLSAARLGCGKSARDPFMIPRLHFPLDFPLSIRKGVHAFRMAGAESPKVGF